MCVRAGRAGLVSPAGPSRANTPAGTCFLPAPAGSPGAASLPCLWWSLAAMPTPPPPVCPQVLKLPRSGGVVVRSRELRQQARKVRVEEYFYGNRKVGAVCVHAPRWGWAACRWEEGGVGGPMPTHRLPRSARAARRGRGPTTATALLPALQELSPASQTARFEDLQVYRVGGGPRAPSSALPIGERLPSCRWRRRRCLVASA